MQARSSGMLKLIGDAFRRNRYFAYYFALQNPPPQDIYIAVVLIEVCTHSSVQLLQAVALNSLISLTLECGLDLEVALKE